MKLLTVALLLALLMTLTFTLEVQVKEGEDHPEAFQDEDIEQVPPQEGSINQRQMTQNLKLADQNGDGQISFEEHSNYFRKYVVQQDSQDWGEYIKDFYDYLNSDGDNVVTIEQYKQFFTGPPEEAEADIQHHGQQPEPEHEGGQQYHQMTDQQYINAEHAHHDIPIEAQEL